MRPGPKVIQPHDVDNSAVGMRITILSYKNRSRLSKLSCHRKEPQGPEHQKFTRINFPLKHHTSNNSSRHPRNSTHVTHTSRAAIQPISTQRYLTPTVKATQAQTGNHDPTPSPVASSLTIYRLTAATKEKTNRHTNDLCNTTKPSQATAESDPINRPAFRSKTPCKRKICLLTRSSACSSHPAVPVRDETV